MFAQTVTPEISYADKAKAPITRIQKPNPLRIDNETINKSMRNNNNIQINQSNTTPDNNSNDQPQAWAQSFFQSIQSSIQQAITKVNTDVNTLSSTVNILSTSVNNNSIRIDSILAHLGLDNTQAQKSPDDIPKL
uniref:Uncharacterized protein n=1 Tax=Bracon brevicornis TaxID=1563983 RepID=A0A6V7L8G1_9HYME